MPLCERELKAPVLRKLAIQEIGSHAESYTKDRRLRVVFCDGKAMSWDKVPTEGRLLVRDSITSMVYNTLQLADDTNHR